MSPSKPKATGAGNDQQKHHNAKTSKDAPILEASTEADKRYLVPSLPFSFTVVFYCSWKSCFLCLLNFASNSLLYSRALSELLLGPHTSPSSLALGKAGDKHFAEMKQRDLTNMLPLERFMAQTPYQDTWTPLAARAKQEDMLGEEDKPKLWAQVFWFWYILYIANVPWVVGAFSFLFLQVAITILFSFSGLFIFDFDFDILLSSRSFIYCPI